MCEIEELEKDIWQAAQSMLRRQSASRQIPCSERRFRALFGVSPSIVSLLWAENDNRPENTMPPHLLWAWALMFMKVYATETVHASLAGVDEKTFRKWCWLWIEHLSSFQTILWQNRFANAAEGATMFVSLDGTDFRVCEPRPFDPMWYSHKFHGAGLRYEVGLCIQTGYIVWINGGAPCGSWSDITLAQSAYIQAVLPGEMTLADRGYRDARYFINPQSQPRTRQRQKHIMSRHETVNARFKHLVCWHKFFATN